MKFESFSFDVGEYAQELTSQSHQTLYWLYKHKYINDEQLEDLLSRMVVTPVRNSPKFGERLLARFFGKDSSDNAYVFPITSIDADAENRPRKGKPKLEVVE